MSPRPSPGSATTRALTVTALLVAIASLALVGWTLDARMRLIGGAIATLIAAVWALAAVRARRARAFRAARS